MSLLARFIAANQRLCKATENHLPQVFKRHIQTLYKYQVAALLNRRPGQVVLDIGGSKECPFLPYINAPRKHLIIALDISERRCAITVGSITRSSPTRRPEDYRFETAWRISSYPDPSRSIFMTMRRSSRIARACSARAVSCSTHFRAGSHPSH